MANLKATNLLLVEFRILIVRIQVVFKPWWFDHKF